MVGHARLTTEHHVASQPDATRQAHLTGQDAMCADLNIMGHLDLVINWPMTVTPNLARSMQVLAPISTSSSIRTVPI